MKIRIKGNTIRYRLTRSEVERFAKEGYVEESTSFINGRLSYALQESDEDQLSAVYEQNKIILFMPKQMVTDWASTGRVGFKGIDGELSLLIEKDFMCLDAVDEDQSDNYPNPLQNLYEARS